MPEQDAPEATEAVLVSEVIPATRERIFAAWMSSEQHSAFTADSAVIEPTVGGKHTTFGGYASGITTALDPFRRIVQTWRSTDFPKSSPDSVLEITLEETVGGTLVTLLHSGIPSGQSDQYREAWGRYYLEPLKRYFTGRLSNGVHAADTRALSARRKRGASRPIATAAKAGAKAGARKAGAQSAGGQDRRNRQEADRRRQAGQKVRPYRPNQPTRQYRPHPGKNRPAGGAACGQGQPVGRRQGLVRQGGQGGASRQSRPDGQRPHTGKRGQAPQDQAGGGSRTEAGQTAWAPFRAGQCAGQEAANPSRSSALGPDLRVRGSRLA